MYVTHTLALVWHTSPASLVSTLYTTMSSPHSDSKSPQAVRTPEDSRRRSRQLAYVEISGGPNVSGSVEIHGEESEISQSQRTEEKDQGRSNEGYMSENIVVAGAAEATSDEGSSIDLDGVDPQDFYDTVKATQLECDDDLVSALYRSSSIIPGTSPTSAAQNPSNAANIITSNKLDEEDPWESSIPSCVETAKLFTTTHDNEPQTWPALFVKHEAQENKAIARFQCKALNNRIQLIVWSTDRHIHNAILSGNFPERYRRDTIFRNAVLVVQHRTKEVGKQPCIYANFIAHGHTGEMMTARQLRKLVEMLRQYFIDDQFAFIIDQVMPGQAKNGCRRYLSESIGDASIPSRVKSLGVLCRALLRRADEATDQDVPLRGSLSEFGYTHDPETRLRNHADHIGSNFLMNLVDAICQVYLQDFMLYQFVVYPIPDLDLVELAEIYFTRAGQGYLENGGGFSHALAGGSTNAKKNYDTEEWESFWDYSAATYMDSNKREWDTQMEIRTRQLQQEVQFIEQTYAEQNDVLVKYRQSQKDMASLMENTDEETSAAKRLANTAEKLDELLQFVNQIADDTGDMPTVEDDMET